MKIWYVSATWLPVNLVLKYGTDVVSNLQNCRLARAARVVCAQPGTVVCSQTPLSLVVCWSGGGLVLSTCWFKSNCIDIKAWLDHYSLLLVAQIKLTLKYLSIRYILQITRHGIISTNFYLFKPPACSIFQDGGICKFVNRMSDFRLKSLIRLTTYLQIT